MYRAIPVSSRLLTDRWQKLEQDNHYQKLKSIKSRVGSS